MAEENIIQKKQKIRKEIRNIALSTPVSELEKNSLLIEQNLFRLPEFVNAETLHIYLSSFRSEVNTFSIIKRFIDKGGKVTVPVVINQKTFKLGHIELKSIDSLKKSSLNIWEPENRITKDPSSADIIIVPGVVFDIDGNRLGSGKGYYDRFLSSINKTKVALAYEFQILDSIPVKKTDIPVDIIISESRIIRSSK